jgi:diguanylate cyclase (GGDEF)-like protein
VQGNAFQAPALNRTRQSAFIEDLETELAATQRTLGLLLVQLADIAELNLRLGYRTVDAALTILAARLAEGFSRDKVVRIGTGRFAIVLRDVKSDAYALLAANKVRRLAEPPLEIGDRAVQVSLAQGVALGPQHAASAEGLFRCAETALEVAREARDSVALYNPDKAAERNTLARLDEELARALREGGLEVVFQPQIEIRSGRLAGAEALLRCRGSDGTWLSPELLIKCAERTGRLAQVTAAVLNTALRYAAEWPDVLLGVSVNASVQSLLDEDFVATVETAVGLWHRRPDTLTVEITESAFMENPQRSFATMRRLRDLGVRVAIDDFGTGYSSLSYFRDIPANELKVDKSFVLRMLAHAADRGIVGTVIGLAHAFGLRVVAEGVEDRETLDLLREMRCDYAQGFLIGRPMPPPAFAAWLDAQRRSGAASMSPATNTATTSAISAGPSPSGPANSASGRSDSGT